MTLLQKAKSELQTFERCSKSTCEELIAVLELITKVPPMPETADRQPFIDVLGNDLGYVEGNGDWADENHEAVTWLADNHAAIRAAITR